MVQKLFPCCHCSKVPVDPHVNLLQRSDFTTASEVSSKRQISSSVSIIHEQRPFYVYKATFY